MREKRYRGNVEIIKEILDTAREERIQNRILFLVNVNVGQFRKYSDALIECGYLEKREDTSNVRYQTTSEGLKALEPLKGAALIVKEVKGHLK
jgi:predicted transcriptional regulator